MGWEFQIHFAVLCKKGTDTEALWNSSWQLGTSGRYKSKHRTDQVESQQKASKVMNMQVIFFSLTKVPLVST